MHQNRRVQYYRNQRAYGVTKYCSSCSGRWSSGSAAEGPKRGTGKMHLVRPPASGAFSMVKSWVRIRDSFSDMVRVMVSVRGRVWIG